ncbi:translesion DNA synthesis-associated protein ImuA [Pseudoduganella lutea]|uniref:translesion DNA synthesis-associated protein ImuA n=1 Tax=Pseudoduganella lutea TaxID=321985 RepID=UPI001E3AF0B5|nr:translesion DNA synthesis-associated protein ImuA [Pseudoduganella lutea]
MAPAALPNVWRASELARSRLPSIATGHTDLDRELPDSGWPRSVLTELLLLQHGIGELQLLKSALASLSRHQRIALVQPPYIPHAMAAIAWGLDPSRLIWIQPENTADALWCTEQLLKSNGCGAVLLWQRDVRNEHLRRLHLAAQCSETWFWLLRPLASAMEPSPAPLRLALRPAQGGTLIEIVKRRGPAADDQIFIPLPDMPSRRYSVETDHALIIQPAPTAVALTSAAPVLV